MKVFAFVLAVESGKFLLVQGKKPISSLVLTGLYSLVLHNTSVESLYLN